MLTSNKPTKSPFWSKNKRLVKTEEKKYYEYPGMALKIKFWFHCFKNKPLSVENYSCTVNECQNGGECFRIHGEGRDKIFWINKIEKDIILRWIGPNMVRQTMAHGKFVWIPGRMVYFLLPVVFESQI